MRDHEAAALAAIRAQYEVAILYTGLGLTAAPMTAIKCDDPAPMSDFGAAGNLRTISFEIQMADVPAEPEIGDIVDETEAGITWRAINVTPYAAYAAWLVVVQADG